MSTGFDAKSFLKQLTGAPGVYRMLDANGTALYVGKARNLRKRVASYFRSTGNGMRIASMLTQVANIEVTVTHTETEALLLENNLIKTLRPRYNILLRDDKSYPYIYLSEGEPYPRVGFHRGAKSLPGRYFGPFPSAAAVRESLNLLQKMFPIRQCEDGFFRNRSRPCLQFQIKRCTAPCVAYIGVETYAEDVHRAALFLEGRNQALTDDLVQHMEQAAEHQDYETAARMRDRIAALRVVLERQYIDGDSGDADILAAVSHEGSACIEVVFVRAGRNLGNKTFFPKVAGDASAAELLSAFLPQYYLGKPTPTRIYLNCAISDREVIEAALSAQANRKISIGVPARGALRQRVRMAEINALDALRRELASEATMKQRREALQEALSLDALPQRLECFDISHTLGEATVASCVVFDENGPLKSDYRRFNIEGVTAGDDYAALQQALTRRYKRIQDGEVRAPDILFIDGGKGQLGVAETVLQELQIGGVKLVAIAKGPERKPGLEQLFLSSTDTPIMLPSHSPALHLIQQIRDEAHRFAITGHRNRRAKARVSSSLEDIPGVGKKRRQALLKNLGGLQSVARAGVEELMRVPGISPTLAQRIYERFHEGQ